MSQRRESGSRSADLGELKAAADRLAAALADMDEEGIAADLKLGAAAKGKLADEVIVLDANILIRAVLGKRVHQLLEEFITARRPLLRTRCCFRRRTEYIPSLLRQRGISDVSVPRALKDLQRLVETRRRPKYTACSRTRPDSA